MRVRMLHNERGFTLVEMMMSVLLYAIIFGACISIVIATQDSYEIHNTKMIVQQHLRKAEDSIKQELVESGASTIANVPADGATYTTITFKTISSVTGGNITWGTDITFLRTGTDLIRRQDGADRTLSQYISLLQFRRLAAAPDIVTVTLQGSKTSPKGTNLVLNRSFKVMLRN